MRRLRSFEGAPLPCALLLLISLPALRSAQPPAGPKTYCNPLPLPSYQLSPSRSGDFLHRSMADPTVIKFKGKWYLFPTDGLLWVSEDLVNWEYKRVQVAGMPGRNPVAPTVLEYKGHLYLTGNGLGLYRSPDPLGPWEYAGDIKDEQGRKLLWNDPMLFADTDGKVYGYWGSGTEGIFGVELKAGDLTQFAGPAKHLFRFDPAHEWERFGDANEIPDRSWVEGGWMTKRNGRYYLQYSAPGTEWKTYAVGVYTSQRPLGPFTYDPRSPILHDRGGLLNGTAHHSVFEGPAGNLWAMYHVLYRNRHRMERRVAMDPVGFDERGRMYVLGPTETPQWAPGVRPKPWLGNDVGLKPLSINKETLATSASPGREARYLVDNNVRTSWEAGDGDAQPAITLELEREFSIEAERILFSDTNVSMRAGVLPGPIQYRVEVSSDRNEFRTVVDRTANQEDRNIDYQQFAPARGRYVRLTITGASKGLRVGVLEFTVFGKP